MDARTHDVAIRQFKTMNCQFVEIGIRDSKSGLMMIRVCSKKQFQESISWLQNMNMKGNDIYIRPAEQERHGLVLVDDLDNIIIEEMKENGHTPILCVETSPGNYQVWLRVENQLGANLRSEIGRVLAKLYDADMNSADHRHFGRLAGFTNRKEKYTTKYGQQPFCLLRYANSNIKFLTPESAALITQAAKNLNGNIENQKSKSFIKKTSLSKKRNISNLNFEQIFINEMQSLERRFSEKFEHSHADWMVGLKLMKMGCSPEKLKNILLQFSPDLKNRKVGHVEDYINRTVNNIKAKLNQNKEA